MAQPSYNREIDRYFWWVEAETMGIAYANDHDGRIYSPAEVVTVKATYVKSSPGCVLDSAAKLAQSPETIPDQFHEAIVSYVLQKAYEKTPEGVKLAVYFKQSYDEVVNEAKAYVSRNHTHGSGRLYVDRVFGIR